ncbi:MAG: M43 family zinc metalloprotease [Chitinophagales bacterium]
MRKWLLGWFGLLAFNFLFAQRDCRSFEYQNQLIQINPSLGDSLKSIENFVHDRLLFSARTQEAKIIKIPVVVHILYHFPGENISDALVKSQIAALNRDYRKQNADTTKIPDVFKPLAADCGLEFQLATVDSEGRATTGIIRKYTPITLWTTDDKIKFSSQMGDDAWNPKSYLNIWVGSLQSLLGYSSMPGYPANKDGVVISNRVFGITKTGIFNEGRTGVHEVGHWLGLRHLWGDTDCGDDSVADTPKQETFTNGCPSVIHISCNNGPNGDMYMDYMDFTNDDCMVMFTEGQKQRMLALFQPGGPRYSILFSNGLGTPTQEAIPLPDDSPKWLHLKIYPNPANTKLTINIEFDPRWVGKELTVLNAVGQVEIKITISSTIQTLDISKLEPGVYFISAEKAGDKIREEFVKF